MAHTCPITDCTRSVGDHLLMCRDHWRLVPTPLQSKLYAAWRRGEGADTPEHHEAMQKCILAVEARA